MSDGLKILNHFIRNLDKTLKILSNRKGDSLRPSIELNLKKCLNDKNVNDLKNLNLNNLLKPESASKQIENIQIVLFSLRKYLEYLISLDKNQHNPINYVQDNLQNIQTKSKETIFNLDKNLRNVTEKLTSNLNELQNIQTKSKDNFINLDKNLSNVTNKLTNEPISYETKNKTKKEDNSQIKSTRLDNEIKKIDKPPIQDFKLIEQKLSENSKATRVPSSRLGLTDSTTNPIFTEANANRIVKTLCKVRGAALKIGQILSIQDLISPELQRIFERVRQSADFMPEYQLRKVLNNELGTEWNSNFKEFDLKPFAAASIGQVHKGILNDGSEVALKIQYPGVADGIDSDLKNLVLLLKVWDVLPPGLFIDSIIKVTKKELQWELDYEREVQMCKEYSVLIDKYLSDKNYKVPKVIDKLCTKKVITTELVHGVPVDKLNTINLDQEIINDVAKRLLNLLLYEIFIFKFMQTDPNWANFFYNPLTNEISLIDFGAARSFPSEFVFKYYQILKAAAHKNEDEILKHSINIGFLTGLENKNMIKAHVDSVLILGKVFEYDDEFDFGEQDISLRIHRTVPVMLENRLVPPPDEIYSLHRKLSGVFMLLVKLRAKVNCRELFNTVSEYYEINEGIK